MQSETQRISLVVVSLTGLLGVIGVGFASGDLRRANVIELILGGLFLCFPSLLLASLGYRKTISVALPRILMASSVLSSSLWLLTALSLAAAQTVDAQSGLIVAFVFLSQWGIAIVASAGYFLLRNR